MGSSNLIPIKKLEEQLERLEQELKENMRRMRTMEVKALTQLNRTKKELSILQHSSEWMNKLLRIVDTLGEIERFIENTRGNHSDVEEVSLESLMECDARIPF